MKKNIIFDYGQVIISYDPYYMTNIYVKDAALCKELSEIKFLQGLNNIVSEKITTTCEHSTAFSMAQWVKNPLEIQETQEMQV